MATATESPTALRLWPPRGCRLSPRPGRRACQRVTGANGMTPTLVAAAPLHRYHRLVEGGTTRVVARLLGLTRLVPKTREETCLARIKGRRERWWAPRPRKGWRSRNRRGHKTLADKLGAAVSGAAGRQGSSLALEVGDSIQLCLACRIHDVFRANLASSVPLITTASLMDQERQSLEEVKGLDGKPNPFLMQLVKVFWTCSFLARVPSTPMTQRQPWIWSSTAVQGRLKT